MRGSDTHKLHVHSQEGRESLALERPPASKRDSVSRPCPWMQRGASSHTAVAPLCGVAWLLVFLTDREVWWGPDPNMFLWMVCRSPGKLGSLPRQRMTWKLTAVGRFGYRLFLGLALFDWFTANLFPAFYPWCRSPTYFVFVSKITWERVKIKVGYYDDDDLRGSSSAQRHCSSLGSSRVG